MPGPLQGLQWHCFPHCSHGPCAAQHLELHGSTPVKAVHTHAGGRLSVMAGSQIKGKTVLVQGASRGIGLEVSWPCRPAACA